MMEPQTWHEETSPQSTISCSRPSFFSFQRLGGADRTHRMFSGTPVTRSVTVIALAMQFSHDCVRRRGATYRFPLRAFDVRFSSMELTRPINAVAFAYRARDPKAALGLGRPDLGNDKWKQAGFAHQQPHRLPPFPTLASPPPATTYIERTTCIQYCWSRAARNAPHCAMNIFLCSTHRRAQR